MYALAAQVLFGRFPVVLAPMLIGLFTGALYRSDVGNLKQWRFPALIQSLSTRFVLPLLRSPPVARSTATTQEQRYEMQQQAQAQFAVVDSVRSGMRNRRARGAQGGEGTAAAGQTVREYIDTLAGRPPPPGITANPPSEEHIDVVSTMFPGQSRERVVRALSEARNDVNRAVEIMLSLVDE